ncbi:toxin MIT1-like [Branchiostoma lanceolatum]|uniref:toxin MIT1-like n=1 Tax=Branchiostoma lanceolatum TaxID=7740 RepID=UPI003451898B
MDMWSPVLLMVVALAALNHTTGLVVTGTCQNDAECITARDETGPCCALWSPGSDLHVCKPAGRTDEPCHSASNVLPYPFNGQRRFWRCQCAEGLLCVTEPGNMIGRCSSADK